jgi:hypothetical protein
MKKNKIAMIAPVAVAGILILSVLAATSSYQAFAYFRVPTKLSLGTYPCCVSKLSAGRDKVGVSYSGKLTTSVISGESKEIGGATITLEGTGAGTLKQETNKFGSYLFIVGLGPGKHTIKADFSGNSEYESSSATNVFTVVPTSSQQSSNAGNAAQGASNTGQGSRSIQTTGGNLAQEGPSGQAGHCKAAVTALSASWYSPYSLYQIRGQLTCGGSGLVGKTITLTSSKLSYVGAFGTVVTREDGYFSSNYRPASTAKPLSTVSAWYLGGPDEGGIASKVVTPQGGPQSSNGNAAQGASNTGQGSRSIQTTGGTVAQGGPSSQAGHCKAAITSLSASYYPPYRNWMVRGQLTCGGSGLSGKTIILTNSKASDVEKLTTVVTREDGYFSTSWIKPTTTTAKPGSPLSAWYLGETDEGGTASKTITLPSTS